MTCNVVVHLDCMVKSETSALKNGNFVCLDCQSFRAESNELITFYKTKVSGSICSRTAEGSERPSPSHRIRPGCLGQVADCPRCLLAARLGWLT